MNESFSNALEAMQRARSMAVISHDRPDGDAIGSVVGMGLMLEGIGKEVIMLNNDGVPDSLQFLPETDRVLSPKEAGKFEVDLILALDSAGRDRISDKVWACLPEGVPVINIDHHASNTRYGDIDIVDVISPATGEIVFDLAEAFGWGMTREIAENLYAAISTDTGSFRYPNTTARTYRAAAGMIEAGVDVGWINQMLYESYPVRRVECIRDLLQDMRLSCDNRCASVMLTLETKNRLGLRPGDTEGVVDIIRAIDTVVVAVFFEELEGGKVRVSSRSKDRRANVGKICEGFGGGGHDLAAGTRMKGPLVEAREKFLAAVEDAFRGW